MIQDFRKVHGDKYDYSKVLYKAWNIKVTIGCPHHGDFEQEPNSHLQGSGCPVCGRLKVSRFGGMTNLDSSQNELARLYLICFKSDKYNFLKVGVTSRTIEDRFKPVAYRQFNRSVILDIEASARDVVNIEKAVLEQFNHQRYYISDGKAFKGCTEIFKVNALNEIQSFIEEKFKALQMNRHLS